MMIKAGVGVYLDAFDGPLKMAAVREVDGGQRVYLNRATWEELEALKKDSHQPATPTAYAATSGGFIEIWPIPDKDYRFDYEVDFHAWEKMHGERMSAAKLRWEKKVV